MLRGCLEQRPYSAELPVELELRQQLAYPALVAAGTGLDSQLPGFERDSGSSLGFDG